MERYEQFSPRTTRQSSVLARTNATPSPLTTLRAAAATSVTRQKSIVKKTCSRSARSPAVANLKNTGADGENAKYLFECPICLVDFTKEVYQCSNGHLLCGSCIEKMSTCGFCKVPLSSRIRNRALELMAPMTYLECPNGSTGCTAKCKIAEYNAHVTTECRYIMDRYCKSLGLKCEAIVSLAELGKHLQGHGIPGVETDEVILRPSSRSAVSIENVEQPGTNLLAYMTAYDHVFSVQRALDFNDRSIWFMVRVSGREENLAKQFSYKIILKPFGTGSRDGEDQNFSVSTFEGSVLISSQSDADAGKRAPLSAISISQTKLMALADASYCMTVSIIPLDSISTVSNTGSGGPVILTCNWAGQTGNQVTPSSPSSPLSPKTPNRRIPPTVTLRQKVLTKKQRITKNSQPGHNFTMTP